MKKAIALILTAAVLAGIFFGVKTIFKKEEPKKEIEYPKQIVYKLASIERKEELPGNVKAKGENEWLIVKVAGVNHDEINRLYNMYYFTFVDEEGTVYENSPNTQNDAMTYGEMAPAGTMSGTIVFKIPNNAIGYLLITDEKYNEIQKIKIK